MRTRSDVEELRAGVLFYLDRRKSEAILAIHIPHNLGYVSLLTSAIRDVFNSQNLVPVFDPISDISAFVRAVQNHHVQKIRLSTSSANNQMMTSTYADSLGEGLRQIAVTFEAKRMRNLDTRNVLEYLDNRDPIVLRDIQTFEGLVFEEVDVIAKLDDGQIRTFSLNELESGQPMSILLNDGDLGPPLTNLSDENNRTADSAAMQLAEELQSVTDIVLHDR